MSSVYVADTSVGAKPGSLIARDATFGDIINPALPGDSNVNVYRMLLAGAVVALFLK